MKRSRIQTMFRRSRSARWALRFLIVEAVAVCLLPYIFTMDPSLSDVHAGFYAAPSAAHLLGTDGAARDLLARTLCGGRVSLLVAVAAPLLSVSIGLPLGLAAGYYRGIVDVTIMRIADVFLTFPNILVSMILLTVIGPSLPALIGVIGVMGWPGIAKLVYSTVLTIREKAYIDSAVTIGRSDWQILLHDVLPGVLSPVLVANSFLQGEAVLHESSLSFLGMGVRSPQVSWGAIISPAQDLVVLTRTPWVWIPSGILIVLTVTAFHFLGEGLRDAMDPYMNQ